MAPAHAGGSSLPEIEWGRGDSAISLALTAFDKRHYLELIRARGDTIRRVAAQLKPEMSLANALDAGCGVGFFAQALEECGLYVRGFDGRLENVVEARRRFPRIPFGQGDIEDPDIARLGTFDLVLCFGLVYHLEHARRRTVLFASTAPVGASCLERVAEPQDHRDPWARENRRTISVGLPRRIQRFLRQPARTQYISLAQHARTVFPEMPIPLRLPFGAWWLAEKGALDHEVIWDGFESAETEFVGRLLRPGMTVLDIGAHHGMYTLLASKRVGRKGRVIAFEPSPRERRRLLRHLRINGCSNVFVEPLALSDHAGEADLFLVEGRQDWCNSLRPPEVDERSCVVRVEVRPLDDVLSALGIARVDFIKLDVEGAELSFLHGASRVCEAHRGRRSSPRCRICARGPGGILRARL